MSPGIFIVFEGLDLTGKTTLIKKLQEKHPEFIYTREPGGTDCKLAEDIRKMVLSYPGEMDALTETYLFAASRAEHMNKIRKWLDQGKTVICDRFVYSSLYYQGIMKGLGPENVLGINQPILNIIQPDILFYVTVSEEERNNRRNQRQEINELDKLSFREEAVKANNDFYSIIKQTFCKTIHVIDTSDNDSDKCLREIENTLSI